MNVNDDKNLRPPATVNEEVVVLCRVEDEWCTKGLNSAYGLQKLPINNSLSLLDH